MGGVLDYSTTAGSNTAVGGVSVAEGMNARDVNNAIRALMADSRKWQIDASGVTTTAGSINAYTFASAQGITAYTTGMSFRFKADKTNPSASTFNVDSVGAKDIKKFTGAGIADVAQGEIVAGGIYDVVYESGADDFILLCPTLSALAVAIGALSSDGLVTRTASGTAAARTVTGTAGQITVTNGNGVSGNPTIAIGTQDQSTWNTGVGTTESGISPAKLNARIVNYVENNVKTWGTAQATTSGTGFNFTGIAATAREIVVTLHGVSLSGTDNLLVQARVSAAAVTTGYTAYSSSSANGVTSTAGMIVRAAAGAAIVTVTMHLYRTTGNTWISSHAGSNGTGADDKVGGSASIALAGALDGITLTRTGANTFDAGSVNIAWR